MERQQALLSASMQNIALRLIISRGRNECFFFPQENTELLLLNIFSILSLMLLLFKEDTTNSELIFFFQ